MNTEIIKVARKAAAHYKNSDGYAQAAEIITMLCDELEKTRRPVAPPTVKDVLLKTWAQDTDAMAYATIDAYYDDEDGWFSLPDGFGTDDPDKAVEHYIAYLNSAAEVGK